VISTTAKYLWGDAIIFATKRCHMGKFSPEPLLDLWGNKSPCGLGGIVE